MASTLDRVKIATPCPANWDDMDGDARVRFCGICQLHVFNLSEMTREDAEDLILQTEGRLCARFYMRSDGTILSQDCPVGLAALRKRIAGLAASIAAAIMMFLGLFGFRAAQAREASTRPATQTQPAQTPPRGRPLPQARPIAQPTPPRNRPVKMGKVALTPPTRLKATMGEVCVTPPTPPKPGR